jgi:DNA/RNA-binding domain of Phe-tRNA-synthetase-like protein
VKHRLRVDPRIKDAFPHYAVIVMYTQNLENSASNEASLQVLREAEAGVRAAFSGLKPADHQHIMAWREAYQKFGLKASKFLCSAEALVARCVKGNELPTINALVDRYNAVNVRHVIPVGGEDWDKLDGDAWLTFADGTEPFETVSQGERIVDHPAPGEVVWKDSVGVTCRAWNWRQCLRTRLTEATCNAYFVLERLEPYPIQHLLAATEELEGHLRTTSLGVLIEREVFGSAL